MHMWWPREDIGKSAENPLGLVSRVKLSYVTFSRKHTLRQEFVCWRIETYEAVKRAGWRSWVVMQLQYNRGLSQHHGQLCSSSVWVGMRGVGFYTSACTSHWMLDIPREGVWPWARQLPREGLSSESSAGDTSAAGSVECLGSEGRSGQWITASTTMLLTLLKNECVN